MATVFSRHGRNDSGVSVHSTVVRPDPPSPTLTNPDMILPHHLWSHEPSPRHPHPLLEPEIPPSPLKPQPQLSDTASISTSSLTDVSVPPEDNVVTGAMGEQVLSAHTLVTGGSAGLATPTAPSFYGFAHGAPLSDIYEESEAAPTPKASRRNNPTTIPSAAPERAHSPSKANTSGQSSRRHSKRISNVSSSSGGSDPGDWETFDGSKVLSGRAAADLAQMKRQESLDVEETASKRGSREEEELVALNARAERILENARQRLTNMGDNLRSARNSVAVPARSPQIGEHQPVGGLYRSISAAGANRYSKKPGFPVVRTSPSLQHVRGASETGVASTTRRTSRSPDVRSASAMDYSPSTKYTLFPDTSQSPVSKTQPSPSSSRSYNTSLRTLAEEDKQTASTAGTTPEYIRLPGPRGLGILADAAVSRDNLPVTNDNLFSRQSVPYNQLTRSASSASTRSAKELRDQMSDLKSRIADLKSKAHTENLKRRSSLGARSSSPLVSDDSAHRSPPTRSLGPRVGVSSPTLPKEVLSTTQDALVNSPMARALSPITPMNQKFLDVHSLTPDAESRILSSARTDRNTPTLARARNELQTHDEENVEPSAKSHYEDAQDHAAETDDDIDADAVAENIEEQVYLNEVLEESLREAEVEPEVPTIPNGYLESPVAGPPERHEDRIDAFDYENMFLHSAMGTYTGKSLNGSVSGSDSDDDSEGSVETSRADMKTPVQEIFPDDPDESYEVATDDEMEAVTVASGATDSPTNLSFHDRTSQLVEGRTSQLQSPARMNQSTPRPRRWNSRGNSMDSTSTAATFETATEGDNQYDSDAEVPHETLAWNKSSVRIPTAARDFHNSPITDIGRVAKPNPVYHTSPGRGPKSPKQTLRTYDQSYPLPGMAKGNIGLGIGVIGGENAQYIADDGVPERFRGQPSPSHSRQSSGATIQSQPASDHSRSASRVTIVNSNPSTPPQVRSQHVRNFSTGRQFVRSPLAHSHLQPDSTGTTVQIVNSPQRKVVINRSLRHAEDFVARPHSPSDMSLPPPPASSQILQAQMASPQQFQPGSGADSYRNAAAPPLISEIPATVPPPPMPTTAPPPAPNTEILMESLIKLADPHFSLTPGTRFADLDKDLVLELLRSVGAVCNSVLLADAHSKGNEHLESAKALEAVEHLRGRLDGARKVLDGVAYIVQEPRSTPLAQDRNDKLQSVHAIE